MHDYAALAALHAQCFTRYPAPWSADAFRAILDSPDCFLIARPCALLVGRVTADESELLTLAVVPDARRMGHARQLVQDYQRLAQKRGAQSGFLEVAEDNLAARALYHAAGWQPAGRRPRYYGAVAALILRRDLTQSQCRTACKYP